MTAHRLPSQRPNGVAEGKKKKNNKKLPRFTLKKPHIRTIPRVSVRRRATLTIALAFGSSRVNKNALSRQGEMRAFVNVSYNVAKISYEEQPLRLRGPWHGGWHKTPVSSSVPANLAPFKTTGTEIASRATTGNCYETTADRVVRRKFWYSP